MKDIFSLIKINANSNKGSQIQKTEMLSPKVFLLSEVDCTTIEEKQSD